MSSWDVPVFVYGTLRRSSNLHGGRIPATLSGVLYFHSCGAYPVAVAHADSSPFKVRGDVIICDERDPDYVETLLMELGAGYNVTWQHVTLDDGVTLRAQVFTWPETQPHGVRIMSGDWLARERSTT